VDDLMGLFDAIDIAGSGMSAQRLRMDVTSENLANAETTRTASGGPYQRQEVILEQIPGASFGSTLASAMGSSSASASSGSAGDGNATGAIPGGVQVAGIVSDSTPGQLVYDPGSPDANAKGYVTMPNVNTVTEMTDLIDESNSYQSDVTAMQTAKSMFSSMLQVLK
jgi:flagellar basal-body rod protein FlgC